jgi:hypothetical protein
MDRIHKLPFILGCLAAMVVGIVSYITYLDNQTIFLRMAVVMTIFFILGVYIRNTVLSIKDEVSKKEMERLRDEELRILQEHEKQPAETDVSKQHPANNGISNEHHVQAQHRVDIVADDAVGEFEPMTVSRVISTKVKE